MAGKKTNKHNKSLEKMKFYDTNFKVLGILSLLIIVSISLLPSEYDISLLFIFIAMIPFLSINWGMLYHQFKSGSYGWFSITLILFIIGFAPISLMLFYWVKMRKEFQKGNGVYN